MTERHHPSKKLLVLLLVGILTGISGLAACSNAGQQEADTSIEAEAGSTEKGMDSPEIPDDLTGGKPWIDSNIAGNVTADTETSPVDDFYLHVNKNWLVSNEIPEGSPLLEFDLTAEPRARMQEALAGDELSEHDAHQAQLLYRTIVDTEARDAAGCEPAKQVIDGIRSLSTVEEMSAFLLDLERSASVPSLIKVHNGEDHEEHRWVTSIELSDETFGATVTTTGMDAATIDPNSAVYQARHALVKNVLTRAGFTDEEAEEAFEGRLNLEKEILGIAKEDEGGWASYTLDQLDGIAGNFPLRELVETRGYGSAEKFRVDEANVRAAATLYTDDHLDDLRSYLICGYALEAARWLDTEAYDAWLADYKANVVAGMTLALPERNKTIEEVATNLVVEFTPTLAGRAYVEGHNLSHTKEFVTDLTKDAVETHKELVNASEWLSDESKQKLTAKLDAMTMNLVYPDVWEDYSGLDLEGLDYYGACRAIWLDDLARNASLTGTEIDYRLWNPASLIRGGGVYTASDNSFRVDAGAVEEEVARYEAGEISFEELLGGTTGYMIFHEPAHALDPGDIYLGNKGEEVAESLLTPSDLKEYQRRTDKIKQYFDGISVWEGLQVDGSVCTNEALAEICAMQARLAYAAKQENFDYRLFFETRGRLYPQLVTPEYHLQCVMGGDSHPLGYLDTNATDQQFDEFYDAFGVKEGDGMYLAPDDRLIVW